MEWKIQMNNFKRYIKNEPYRTIPQEDMLLSSWDDSLFEEFQDGVYCECSEIIRFKNRKPYETVRIICPKCGSEILYG